jgi:hypothetical protein
LFTGSCFGLGLFHILLCLVPLRWALYTMSLANCFWQTLQ